MGEVCKFGFHLLGSWDSFDSTIVEGTIGFDIFEGVVTQLFYQLVAVKWLGFHEILRGWALESGGQGHRGGTLSNGVGEETLRVSSCE